jgi:hypothetical protein
VKKRRGSGRKTIAFDMLKRGEPREKVIAFLEGKKPSKKRGPKGPRGSDGKFVEWAVEAVRYLQTKGMTHEEGIARVRRWAEKLSGETVQFECNEERIRNKLRRSRWRPRRRWNIAGIEWV